MSDTCSICNNDANFDCPTCNGVAAQEIFDDKSLNIDVESPEIVVEVLVPIRMLPRPRPIGPLERCFQHIMDYYLAPFTICVGIGGLLMVIPWVLIIYYA